MILDRLRDLLAVLKTQPPPCRKMDDEIEGEVRQAAQRSISASNLLSREAKSMSAHAKAIRTRLVLEEMVDAMTRGDDEAPREK